MSDLMSLRLVTGHGILGKKRAPALELDPVLFSNFFFFNKTFQTYTKAERREHEHPRPLTCVH